MGQDKRRMWLGMGVVLLWAVTGCRVESSKKENSEQFRLATPMGALQVKTDAAAAASGVGLPVYAGATLLPKGKEGDDGGSADIDLSLGNMRLRVKALRYRSGDTPDEVRAFYAKELGRFGVVIACHDERAVGEPARTPEGLMCGSDGQSGVHVESADTAVVLKAGSPQHQHLVEIKKAGAGTEFALVALDLPRRLVTGNGEDAK